MKKIVSGVFLCAAALALVLAGCDSGQIRVGSEEVQIQSNDPAPQVISMTKTANASTLSGPIHLYLGMSEQLVSEPSVVYEAIFGGSASASASKASEPVLCALIDGGSGLVCSITVAGCNAMVDYAVRVSGGESVKGVEMEPFEMILNSGDVEADSIDEIDNCWGYFDGATEKDPTFDEIAELEIVGGSLEWQILSALEDFAQANVFKELYGYSDVAVAMRVVGESSFDFGSGANFAGMQFNLMAESESLSSGYRALVSGMVLTTWSDDLNLALYAPTLFDPEGISAYYTCVVKDAGEFKYFVSTDGVDYVELTSDNMELAAREDCGLPAPLDAGWHCPDDPMTELCDPDADWGGDCPGTYEDCLAYIEDFFTDELCSGESFGEILGILYDSPIVRLVGYGSPGETTPKIDYARFRTTNITGDVLDCPVIY
jgi:hypothetical protein